MMFSTCHGGICDDSQSQKYVKSMMLSNIVNIFGVVDIFQYHMI